MNPGILQIETDQELAFQVEEIGQGPLCLDTEADSFHHYRESLCLVQMSFGGRDVLVDPMAGVDLRLLSPALEDPGVRTILHDAGGDLRLLDRDFGLRFRGLFDTMVAARLTGELSFGLSALLEKFLGLEMDKKMQRADWTRRPLTPRMQTYAVMDTRHLQQLAELLEETLRDLGRIPWAEEEFERLESVRWNGGPDRSQAFLRIKGAHRLSRRSLAVLRELWEIRDRAARKRDVALFRVMGNEVLLHLSASPPDRPTELKKVPGMPRSWTRGRRADELLEGIRRALGLPDPELPARRKIGRSRPDPETEERVRELRTKRDRIGEDLGLDPPLIAGRRVLEELARMGPEGLEEGAIPELRRWQASLLGALF